MFRRAVFRLGWLFVVATYASVASAANDVWDNNPGGNWETGANWTDGSTPGTGDTATFNLAATYPVTFGVAPTAIQALTVSAGTVTFQSSGGAKTLNVNSGGVQDVAVTGASTLLTLGASLNPLNLTAGDDLSVQSGATLNVVFGSDVVANDLTANGLNGTLLVNGSGSSLTLNSAAQHLIANTLPGSLLFQNSSTGNSIAGGLRIADNASGVTGSVSITGGSDGHDRRFVGVGQPERCQPERLADDQQRRFKSDAERRVDDHGGRHRQWHGRDQHRHHRHRRHAHDRHRTIYHQRHRNGDPRERRQHGLARCRWRHHDRRRTAAIQQSREHLWLHQSNDEHPKRRTLCRHRIPNLDKQCDLQRDRRWLRAQRVGRRIEAHR